MTEEPKQPQVDKHPHNNGSGLARAFRAARISVKGLRAAFENESAFRQELALALVFIPLAFYLGQTPSEQLLLVGSVFLVFITELVNSSIEAVVDRVGTEFHTLSGRAKDVASAAVFLSLMFAGLSFAFIAFHRFA